MLFAGGRAKRSALWVPGLAALPPLVCVTLSSCRNCVEGASQATQPDLRDAWGFTPHCSGESTELAHPC